MELEGLDEDGKVRERYDASAFLGTPGRVTFVIDRQGIIRHRFSSMFSADEHIEEVVVATGTSVEGEATAAYISRQLVAAGTRVSRIASGVPMGGDLKFVDQVTLQRAMERRHEL